ncbi:MAG: sulfotransferase [Phormidesmis sp.]
MSKAPLGVQFSAQSSRLARRPTFIIVGAMKCATTTLHEQLSAQPGLFMSEPKEPNFFSDDDIYARGLDWYLSLFSAAGPTDICGESSTHYTKLPTHPRTLRRLRSHFPDMKLVYVMRHPVERMVSQYVHEWSQRTISGSLAQSIKRYPELYQYSLYAMQLRPYLEAFGHQSVLPVFLERIKQDPAAELARIGRFVGCPAPTVWQSETAHRHASKDRLRRNAVRDAVVNAPVLRQVRRHFIPKSMRTWVRGLWQMQTRPQLSKRDRTWIEAKLNPDLAQLGEWLGVSLSCQNFSTAVTEGPMEWVADAMPMPATAVTQNSRY